MSRWVEVVDICSKFVEKYATVSHSLGVIRNGYTGWRFVSHSTWPAFSYMIRNTTAKRVHDVPTASTPESFSEETDLEEEAPVYISQQKDKQEFLNVVQYIVYSPTFCVPAFYFLIYDRDGSPLVLEELVSTSLFKTRALLQTVVHQSYITLDRSHLDPTASVFPLLSQGDHPVLQIPCWYFHPCETERAIKELLKERADGGGTIGPEQWLETWLVVLSTVVNLEEQ